MENTMNLNITLTEAAYAFIKKKIETRKGIGFRLSIKETGCSGYSYSPAVVEKIKPDDISFKFKDDLIVFVDPAWLSLLQGVIVDCQEDNKSGIKQKRLIFTNPNEANRCGCGESFHIE